MSNLQQLLQIAGDGRYGSASEGQLPGHSSADLSVSKRPLPNVCALANSGLRRNDMGHSQYDLADKAVPLGMQARE